ncbi:MAG TPA: hypothetical protein VD963_10325, partial [Phycisphaerales bacterium]|nr:hypothetical protein [Phycisphaerales bacterium]
LRDPLGPGGRDRAPLDVGHGEDPLPRGRPRGGRAGRDALASRLAYAPTDLVIIDWNAALLLAPPGEADDVRAVLEFANVELLEMRFLDDRLDETLDRAYVAMDRVTWRRAMIPGADAAGVAKLARLQVDHALLFEGVNNALKLLGDQYLARVYRMAAARLHLPEWDASVLRKLQTVQDIYEKITGRLDARRMETLEWIIIVLILVSIVMPFVVTYGH